MWYKGTEGTNACTQKRDAASLACMYIHTRIKIKLASGDEEWRELITRSGVRETGNWGEWLLEMENKNSFNVSPLV